MVTADESGGLPWGGFDAAPVTGGTAVGLITGVDDRSPPGGAFMGIGFMGGGVGVAPFFGDTVTAFSK